MASLGNDLATIRKQQDLSLDDVHNTTKIPVHILQAIENDSIFSDFDENKTYVRSFIRTYGRALKLDDSEVVKALDDYEVGIYSGHLLGEDAEERTSSSTEEKSEPVKPEKSIKPESVVSERPEAAASSESDSGPVGSDHVAPASDPPPVSSVDWADMGKKFAPLQSPPTLWFGIIVIILIVAALAFFWFYQNNPEILSTGQETSETGQNLSQPAVAPDSLQLNLTDAEEDTSSALTSESMESLPDTLSIMIYAAYGKLEPIRVFTDVMGDLNPYWIEEREAIEFSFVNEIRVRGQYSRMELLLNGHPIENFRERFYNPDTRMLEIQRSVFEENDQFLQPPPDTSALDFPPPTTILDRPNFN